MTLKQATILRIQLLLKENNFKVYTLSCKSGIPTSTLSDLMKGKTRYVKLSTILHICEGLDITLKDFFNDKIFMEVVDE